VATAKKSQAALAASQAGEVVLDRISARIVLPLTWLSVLMGLNRGFHCAALRSTPGYSHHAATAAKPCRLVNVASGCITLVSEELRCSFLANASGWCLR
jgi:hypothetical protein